MNLNHRNCFAFLLVGIISLQSVGTALSAVKLTIEDTPKTPRAYCSVQKKNPTTSKRPVLRIHGTTLVQDFDTNGIIDEKDIQTAIDKAHTRAKKASQKGDPGMQRVVLPLQDKSFFIKKTINLKSWVLLEGRGEKITAHPDFYGSELIFIGDNIKNAGVYDLEMRAVGRTNGIEEKNGRGLISINRGASAIFIYDNLFVSDHIDDRENIGNNNGWHGVYIGNDVSQLYIDSNRFSHVPLPISILGENTSFVRITHNLIANWRTRGIWVRGTKNPIHDITIAHNRIMPPKTGTVRQPIAFQRFQESDYTYNVKINDNYIKASGAPHIAKRDPVTGERITTSTDGTADMISMHWVKDFIITRNCIIDGGELGIAVSFGSRDGEISLNHIENADVAGIALGANKADPVSNIDIQSNNIINPARNRAKHKSPNNWPFAGIVVIRGEEITYGNNTIRETERSYFDDGTPQTLSYGVSIWRNSEDQVVDTAPNIYDFASDVTERAVTRER